MGAVDKFLNKLSLGNPSEEDYYDYDTDEEYEDKSRKVKSKDSDENLKKFNKVSSIGNKKKISSDRYEIIVVKPETVDNEKEIADGLLSGKAVLLNLTLVEFDIARRVLDFAMGSIYTLDGAYQKITDTIFLFVPNGIDISGAFGTEPEEDK